MGKEAGNKDSQKKKNNPTVVIQEKTTKVAKRDNTIKLRECSVFIENIRDESAHVLRNRIVKTELKTKTPAPLLETSTFTKVSKRTQENDSDDESMNVPVMKPTKISVRLANRSKSCIVEKTTKPPAKKSKDVLKKVTVSSVQLKEKNVQKNGKPITSKLQNKGEKEDKTSEKESTLKKNEKYVEAPIKQARLKKKEPTIEASSKETTLKKNEETIEAPLKEARLKKKKPTIEAPIRDTRLQKKKNVPIKVFSKHLNNKCNVLKEVEVFSSQNEEEESFLAPKTVVQSPIKMPLTKAKKIPVNNSLSSKEPQKSPTYRLKLPVADDDDLDDIYDFPMSSSMIENPKVKKVNKSAAKKTRIRQNGKAGSKLELLMKKSTMNVVGNSCHVQNNPEIYKMKQIEMNKLIFAQKTRTNSPKPQLRKVVKQSTVENISDDDDDGAIASDSLRNHVDSPIAAASSTFKSPVNKNFSGLVMKNPNSSASPFRISNETIFPRTFYMQLGSGTMPSYSSDCINIPDRRTFNVSSESRKSLESKIPEIFTPITVKPVEEAENDENQAENDENQPENNENLPVILVTPAEKSQNTNTSIPFNNSSESFLGDSNAENVEPVGLKSPSKVRKLISAMKSPLKSTLKLLRSPLKSLPIPSQSEFGAVSSPLVVFNLTAQQLISPKKIASIKTATNKATEKSVDKLKSTKSLDLFDDSVNNEQDDFSKMLATFNDPDEPQPCTSKQSEAREHLNFDMKLKEVQNEFGFDELLEESRSGIKTTTSGNNNEDVDDEIKMHLQNLKKYLPSRQNKDRTKEIFATSPLKKTKNLFKSPMVDHFTDIRKAFHASTPVNVLKKQQLMRNIFMNTSKIEIPADPVEKETSENQQDGSSLNQQDESVNVAATPEISVSVNEEVVDENLVSSNLFNDQSELFLNVSPIFI